MATWASTQHCGIHPDSSPKYLQVALSLLLTKIAVFIFFITSPRQSFRKLLVPLLLGKTRTDIFLIILLCQGDDQQLINIHRHTNTRPAGPQSRLLSCPALLCSVQLFMTSIHHPLQTQNHLGDSRGGKKKRKSEGESYQTRHKAPSALLNWYLFSQATSFIRKLPKLKQNLKKEKCTHESYNKHMDMQKIWSWNTGFWMPWNQVKIYFMQHQLHKRNQNNIKPFQKTFTLSIPIFLISSWTWLSLSLSLYIYIYIYIYIHTYTQQMESLVKRVAEKTMKDKKLKASKAKLVFLPPPL